MKDGVPTAGVFDFQFSLFSAPAGGVAVAGPLTNGGVVVADGLFTTSLDFGAIPFTGIDLWVEIGVSTSGGENFKTLAPRQALGASPLAIYAANAGFASSVTGPVSSSQLSGTIPTALLPLGLVTTNGGLLTVGTNGSFLTIGGSTSPLILTNINGAFVLALAPPIPPQVAGVVAAAGPNSISLVWAPSTGAASYNVRRSTNSGGETFLKNVQTTWYADGGLVPGVNYYYEVSGVSLAGEGANSAEVFAAPVQGGDLSTNLNPWIFGAGAGAPGYPWATGSAVSGGTTPPGRTFAVSTSNLRLVKGGTVYAAAVSVYSVDPTETLKFKVLRPNGLNYDLVSESELFTPTQTGSNYFVLAHPMTCQEGDVPGIFISSGRGLQVDTANPGLGPTMYYDAVDLASANVPLPQAAGGYFNVTYWVDAPLIAYTGDSITAGHNDTTAWYPQLDLPNTILSGQLSSSYPWCASTNFASLVTYGNYARGGMCYDWVATNAVPRAVSNNAMVLWSACGVNDVALGRTWSMVLTNLGQVRSVWPSTNALLIAEILPWSAGSDAQALTIRTWNTNLLYWCQTNNATLARMHDGMGQIRPRTGQPDDLYAPFNKGDNTHLSQAGVSNYVYLMRGYLQTVIKTP